MSNTSRRTRIVLAAAVMALSVGTTITYALLPSTSVPPASVAIGTLAGKTQLNVLSVDAFTRAINQAHGSNAVLQHLHFAPGQSTGWHRHPGPNIVLIVKGSFTLIDEHCAETQYGPGKGFATGLDVHEEPYIVRGNRTLLEPGMCFSNEPTICIYGEFGVRLEDHIYMAADGAHWFTTPAVSFDDPFGVEA